jgi:hypothetical protein
VFSGFRPQHVQETGYGIMETAPGNQLKNTFFIPEKIEKF